MYQYTSKSMISIIMIWKPFSSVLEKHTGDTGMVQGQDLEYMDLKRCQIEPHSRSNELCSVADKGILTPEVNKHYLLTSQTPLPIDALRKMDMAIAGMVSIVDNDQR